MDVTQLSQGYSATTKKQFYFLLQGRLEFQDEPTLEPRSGFERGPLSWESSVLTTRPLYTPPTFAFYQRQLLSFVINSFHAPGLF